MTIPKCGKEFDLAVGCELNHVSTSGNSYHCGTHHCDRMNGHVGVCWCKCGRVEGEVFYAGMSP